MSGSTEKPASSTLKPASGLLRLRLRPTAESVVRGGHPWIFSDSIREQNRDGRMGELAAIYDRNDSFLAMGLFDPDSPIRVRVLLTGRPEKIDAGWWRRRLESALARRAGLFDAQTTGHRWINGESDGWPGLVLDRYDSTLVLKLYTAAWLPRIREIKQLLAETIPCERIVLRLSRNIQPLAEAQFQLREGAILHGAALNGIVTFQESGLRFEADALRGQKTGFFLDQRENRRRVEKLAHGREVLNAFSFSGGFSLYAARGGARAVTDLDISPHALAAARRNFALNQSITTVAACQHEVVQADAFEWLADGMERQFDLIILDPPSLAKREAERERAIQAYGRLAGLALQRLRAEGTLVAASCSAHVTAVEFFAAVRDAARRSRRRFEELETTGHAADHAANFREAEYLKCIYLRC